MSAVLFIDTNQYLKLYGLVDGKKLLDLLEKHKSYIFVAAQIVDEVLRNKLGCAQVFFSDKLKEIEAIEAPVPDNLLGISNDKINEFRNILESAKNARKELTDYAPNALLQISQSEDELSKRLERLFDNSIKPTIDQLKHAKERREMGNPPGKARDTLGDQITWEQLLTYCTKSKSKRLWIITEDTDYLTKYGKNFFVLNAFLHKDLTKACGATPEIHCFNNLMAGVRDFDKNAGVQIAEKLLTEEESAAIETELNAVQPVGSMSRAEKAVGMLHVLGALGSILLLESPFLALQALGQVASGAIRSKSSTTNTNEPK